MLHMPTSLTIIGELNEYRRLWFALWLITKPVWPSAGMARDDIFPGCLSMATGQGLL